MTSPLDGTVMIPLEHLRIGPDHVPGLDLDHVKALIDKGNLFGRPLQVEPCGYCEEDFIILNGRHRYVAALVIGYAELPCTLIPDWSDPSGPIDSGE